MGSIATAPPMSALLILVLALVVLGSAVGFVMVSRSSKGAAGARAPRSSAHATAVTAEAGKSSEGTSSSNDKPGSAGVSASSVRSPSVRPPAATASTPPPAHSGPRVEVEPDVSLEDEPSGITPMALVTAVGRSDPGLRRKLNEDCYLLLAEKSLFVVADGMGRHAAGEVASRLAVDTIQEAFLSGDFGPHPSSDALTKYGNRLLSAVMLANEKILTEASQVESYHGMGTTVVALLFSPSRQQAAVVHAGDSRCYRLRGGQIQQITHDHTLGAAGIVGPSAYVLSKAVGIEPHVEPDVAMVHVEPEDVYLLCSDGLSRLVADEEVLKAAKGTRDLDLLCQQLIDKANASGGRDNITVLLIRVEDPLGTHASKRGKA